MPVPPLSLSASATYEIRLRGHLDARWAEHLGIPSLVHEPDGTSVLAGLNTDQAGLHGLLQRIRDLGLPLISVLRIDADRPNPQP